MRQLHRKEITQRGCAYCLESVMKKYGGHALRHCPHDECPYHELDKYETYKEYLKQTKINLGDLLGFKVKAKK